MENVIILKACTVNVNSIFSKVSYLHNLIHDENLDMVAVTETWLTDACSSSFISIPGFSLLRGDVTGTIRKHGAAIYVRSALKHVQIEVSLPNLTVLHLIDFDICDFGL